MALTVGSLFSGIGGIDLGLERAGMVTRWFVEWDAHCQNVLRRHWPGVPVYGDITAVDWGAVEPVDVLAGGFPCQPVSNAGYRRGTDDERWLWPEFERAVGVLRPRYVLVENVAALRHRGLGIVLSGLAALGYDAEWDCIPAASVGAPHVRDRLWLVAYPPQRPQRTPRRTEPQDSRGMAHADGEWKLQPQGLEPDLRRRIGDSGGERPSGEWPPEPRVGRVAHGVPHRVDRLRALGNAVVPQVVEWIGRRIVAFDEEVVA